MGTETTHKVRIICNPSKNVVVPGYLIVNRTDSVEFKTVNNKDATIFIPTKKQLFEENKRVLDLDEAHKYTATLTVQQNAPAGVYTYAVYCKESDDFAEGNSPPRMIIEE